MANNSSTRGVRWPLHFIDEADLPHAENVVKVKIINC